jgi:hypothetical protein
MKNKKEKTIENNTISKLKRGMLSRILTKYNSSLCSGDDMGDPKMLRILTILSNMKSIRNKQKEKK